jgi:N-acetylglutamate synthase-like GNAT family acetyltransferase
MSTPQPQVRRATVDDLPKLASLWREENLPADELEKRFKEFQVVEDENGDVLGAIGLQIADQQGRLHGEVFVHAEQADMLRQKLWERAQILANNFGLVRVWTQLQSPFWHANGFTSAGGDVLAKLPGTFIVDPGPWRFVQLREEVGTRMSLDKEFAMFKEAERERTEQMFRQARVLKVIAFVIAGVVVVIIIVFALKFFTMRSRQMNQ